MKTLIRPNFELFTVRHEGRDIGTPWGAYARNLKTSRTWYIGSYSTEERAFQMGGNKFDQKFNNQPSELKSFFNN